MYCEHCGSGPACGVCGRDDQRPAVPPRSAMERVLDEVLAARYAVESGQYATAREGMMRAEWALRSAPRGWDHV